MPADACDLEGTSLYFYTRAGVDPANDASALRVALNTPKVAVEFVADLAVRARLLVQNDGTRLIEVRKGLSACAINWLVGHELWHVYRKNACGELLYVERAANNFSACVNVPSPALFIRRHRLGAQLAKIAGELDVSETIVALRWGEACGDSVAVVSPWSVQRRGPDGLPGDAELRKIVRAGGGDGAKVVRLSDVRDRWWVRIEG